MSSPPLYRSRTLELTYEADDRWLYARWIDRQSAQDIREGGAAMLQAMRNLVAANACVRVLNDNREVKGSWSHSVEWAATVWLPDMFNAGLRHFGWVLSPDAFAALSSMRMALSGGPLAVDAIQTFVDLEEAKTWLRKCSG